MSTGGAPYAVSSPSRHEGIDTFSREAIMFDHAYLSQRQGKLSKSSNLNILRRNINNNDNLSICVKSAKQIVTIKQSFKWKLIIPLFTFKILFCPKKKKKNDIHQYSSHNFHEFFLHGGVAKIIIYNKIQNSLSLSFVGIKYYYY